MATATFINHLGNTVTASFGSWGVDTKVNDLLYSIKSSFILNGGTGGNAAITTAFVVYPGGLVLESSHWAVIKVSGYMVTVSNQGSRYQVVFSEIFKSITGIKGTIFDVGLNTGYPRDLTEVIKLTTTSSQYYRALNTDDEVIEYICSKKLTYNNLPVYVDKTKVNYTDGTYSIKDGALDATSARSEGYKYLLNTYGTFYRGTEEELSDSFITGLDSL